MNNGLSIITNVILAQTDLFREQIHLGSWQGPENRTHSVAGAPSFVRFSGPCQEPRRICKKSWWQHEIEIQKFCHHDFFEIGVFANITLVIITSISTRLSSGSVNPLFEGSEILVVVTAVVVRLKNSCNLEKKYFEKRLKNIQFQLQLVPESQADNNAENEFISLQTQVI